MTKKPFSLRRLIADTRRALKKEMDVPNTYGPPYLENMHHVDMGLIEQCDQGEPNAQEIHGALNEGIDPNCQDPENFGETPLFKIARHCGGRDVMKIAEMLKLAGVKGAMCIDKVNELGLSPLCRAAMSAPPPGPPKKMRLKFMQWLINERANPNHVDKVGGTEIGVGGREGRDPPPAQSSPFAPGSPCLRMRRCRGGTPSRLLVVVWRHRRLRSYSPPSLRTTRTQQRPHPQGGFTPLCHAASHGDYDGVRLLLENGAEVEPVSGKRKRPVKVSGCPDGTIRMAARAR